MLRLNYYYNYVLRNILIERFGIAPQVKSINLNMTSKKTVINTQEIIPMITALEIITGEKAQITKVKRSLAAFGIKEKMPIGVKIELKDEKMYVFLDLLISLILSQIGLEIQLTLKDNKTLNLGIKDLTVFPQIEEKIFKLITGMNITIKTNSRSKEQLLYLMRGFQIPVSN